MPTVALETRDLAIAHLAALPSPNHYFYPLTRDQPEPLSCFFVTQERDYGAPRLPAVLARIARAAQMVRYLLDCYHRLSGATEAREVHICSLLAFLPIWWWRRGRGRHDGRRTLVLYARRTELATLRRGPRVILARFALSRADVVVVESDALKDYVCTHLGARPERVRTVEDLIDAEGVPPIAVLYMHPERRALFDLCRGRGIDVGCGSNKTHPRAIGVDLTPAGQYGQYGNQRLQVSEADVVSSGDDLHDFSDASLDYVVERHNLEHYLDPVKTLLEWRRVLKPGGIVGLVVPDDAAVDTIPLDPTHKHAFTMDSLVRLLEVLGGLEVTEKRPCVPGWSFLVVARKTLLS